MVDVGVLLTFSASRSGNQPGRVGHLIRLSAKPSWPNRRVRDGVRESCFCACLLPLAPSLPPSPEMHSVRTGLCVYFWHCAGNYNPFPVRSTQITHTHKLKEKNLPCRGGEGKVIWICFLSPVFCRRYRLFCSPKQSVLPPPPPPPLIIGGFYIACNGSDRIGSRGVSVSLLIVWGCVACGWFTWWRSVFV